MEFQERKDRNRLPDKGIDYSKYFHEERIPFSENGSSNEEHVKLTEVSAPEKNHSSSFTVPEAPNVYFQCELCEMLVGEDDSKCPFCGSEFAEDEIYGPAASTEDESQDEEEAEDEYDSSRFEAKSITDEQGVEIFRPALPDDLDIRSERDTSKGVRPADEQNDDIRMKAKPSDIMLKSAATKGKKQYQSSGASSFSRSAKLLQKMEKVVDQASDFGAETREARRLLVAAWKACEEGNWNIVTSLAEETKKSLVPNVREMIRKQISALREVILDMKYSGIYVIPHITKIKLIRKAIDEVRLDEAIELTKELIDETREARIYSSK